MGGRWWVRLGLALLLGSVWACGGGDAGGADGTPAAEVAGAEIMEEAVADAAPWEIVSDPGLDPAPDDTAVADAGAEDAPPLPFDRAACLVDPACDRVMVAAHRGHHTHLPENSIAGLRSGARLGVDFVEIDVRDTADGALVLMHDGDVDRTTDGSGAVADLTLTQIEALTLDGGDPEDPESSRVPTFAQALAAARAEGVLLYVDQKTDDTAAVIAAIAAADAWDLALVRDDLSVVADMAASEPRLRVMPYVEGGAGFDLALTLIDPLLIVEVAGGLYDPDLVARVRAAGVKVQQDQLGPADVLGSVGDYSGWKRAIDAGVTLPQTDFPQVLVPAAAERNASGEFPASGPTAADY